MNGEAVWDLSDPVGQSVFLGRFRDMRRAGFSVRVDDPDGVGEVGGEVGANGR